jgi:hypothetical protein
LPKWKRRKMAHLLQVRQKRRRRRKFPLKVSIDPYFIDIITKSPAPKKEETEPKREKILTFRDMSHLSYFSGQS